MIAYLGSYHGETGLTVAETDDETGALTLVRPVPDVPNASWLATSPDGEFLYTTNESAPRGGITVLSLADPDQPRVLGQCPSGGPAPTHLSVHPTGEYLFTANYGDGRIQVNPLADGEVGPPTDLVDAPDFAEAPHAHQILPDPSGNWLLGVDLGANTVSVYALDNGQLALHQEVELPIQVGPRHLAFHPDGRTAYLLAELVPVLLGCTWDADQGELSLASAVRTASTDVTNYPGEVIVSPDGKFGYVSNRGDNSVATFALSGSTMRLVNTVPTGGNWPRHLALHPSGNWLYAANQRSGTVTWLPRDPDTGQLAPAAGSVSLPHVAMVMFR